MTYSFPFENQEIPILIQPHPRAKSFKMRYCDVTHSLKVTTPRLYREKTLKRFLDECHPWVVRQLTQAKNKWMVNTTQSVSVFGENYEFSLAPLKKPGLWAQGNQVELSGDPGDFATYVEDWAKDLAKQYFTEKSTHYADIIGKKVARISIRDAKTRWGSCSSSGTLSFNWRVAFAPLQVAEYLCIHEVCHLAEMNHGPQFWGLVARLQPDYEKHKKWLRVNGKRLQRLAFKFPN